MAEEDNKDRKRRGVLSADDATPTGALSVPQGDPLSPPSQYPQAPIDPELPALPNQGAPDPTGSALIGSLSPQPPLPAPAPPLGNGPPAGSMPQMPPQGTQGPSAPPGPPMAAQDPNAPQQAPMPPQGVLAGPTPPQAPPPAGALSPQAPVAPQRPAYSAFDKKNRGDTLLAISKGLLSHPESFAAGVGSAAEGIDGLRKAYQAKPTMALGGPDNSFQITTDPHTGSQTYAPVSQFQNYLAGKASALKAPQAPSAKDSTQFIASTAKAIAGLPANQQAYAWAAARIEGHRLGYNMDATPQDFTPQALPMFAGQGVSVAASAAADAKSSAAKVAQANSDRLYGLKVQAGGLAMDKFNRGPAKPAQAAAAKLHPRFTLDPH